MMEHWCGWLNDMVCLDVARTHEIPPNKTIMVYSCPHCQCEFTSSIETGKMMSPGVSVREIDTSNKNPCSEIGLTPGSIDEKIKRYTAVDKQLNFIISKNISSDPVRRSEKERAVQAFQKAFKTLYK